jgi:hypothetical protein
LIAPSRARVIFGEAIDLADIGRELAGDKMVQAEVSRRFKTALMALQERAFSQDDGMDAG